MRELYDTLAQLHPTPMSKTDNRMATWVWECSQLGLIDQTEAAQLRRFLITE